MTTHIDKSSIARHQRNYVIKFHRKGELIVVKSNWKNYAMAAITARCMFGNNWRNVLYIE